MNNNSTGYLAISDVGESLPVKGIDIAPVTMLHFSTFLQSLCKKSNSEEGNLSTRKEKRKDCIYLEKYKMCMIPTTNHKDKVESFMNYLGIYLLEVKSWLALTHQLTFIKEVNYSSTLSDSCQHFMLIHI